MEEKNIKWLYEELPKLIQNGIITDTQGIQIKDYYGEIDKKNWMQRTFAIFAILGSILIGTGIILLLAKNWANLSRQSRAIISVSPVIAGQVLGFWVILKKRESVAWREGVASFIMISIGIAISLIGQTYNFPGEMDSFLFTWMILSIPLIYLMNATIPGVFYLFGITAWAGSVQSQGGEALLFWVLAAFMVPHLWKVFNKEIDSNRFLFLSWTVSIVFCISIGITLEKVLPGLWIVVYSSYFAILYFISNLYLRIKDGFWEQPFKVVGIGGILVLAVMGTYRWPWRSIGWNYYRNRPGFIETAGIVDYLLAGLLFIIASYLLYLFIRRNRQSVYSFGFIPILSGIGYIMVSTLDQSFWIIILYNIYLLILGLETVIKGIRKQSMPIVNGGMLILSLMILLRFFDSDWGFAIRGIAFISIGIGFLVSNYILWKKREGGGVA